MKKLSIIQNFHYLMVLTRYIPCNLRTSFLIFNSAVEHWSHAHSCPHSTVHWSGRCNARQAYRWFYSLVPCTAIMLFNIAKGSLRDEGALLLYPANVISFVDGHSPLYRNEGAWFSLYFYFFFNVCSSYLSIRVTVEHLTCNMNIQWRTGHFAAFAL